MRRWKLTEQAYDLMAEQRAPGQRRGRRTRRPRRTRSSGSSTSASSCGSTTRAKGPAFVAHPETDFHGSAAASRYLIHAAADEAYIGYLIHDDPALFREALDDGRAFEARVVRVYDVGVGPLDGARAGCSGSIRSLPHRLRENARVAPYGSRGHEATIVEIDATESDLLVTVEWTGRKTKPLLGPIMAKPADDAWVGVDVAFVQSDAASADPASQPASVVRGEGPGRMAHPRQGVGAHRDQQRRRCHRPRLRRRRPDRGRGDACEPRSDRRGVRRPPQGPHRLHLSRAARLAVVKAPPGSGKTHTLIEVLSTLAADGMRIAVAAQTNSQADDICQRWAKDHPEVRVARFSSRGLTAAEDFPASVRVGDRQEGAAARPGRHRRDDGQVVADRPRCAVRPARHRRGVADELGRPHAVRAGQRQVPDDRRPRVRSRRSSRSTYAAGRPRPVLRTRQRRRWCLPSRRLESVRFVGSLPACRRLPNESVDFVKPFYDFDFEAYVAVGDRGLELLQRMGRRARPAADRWRSRSRRPTTARPSRWTTRSPRPPRKVVGELLECGATLRFGDGKRPLDSRPTSASRAATAS